ncbi:MAG: GntR family transcriptional regulator [Chloroflexota bacterium]|nr:GntR family transcriptional regulator [Chloroflexota bacterium]
MRGSLRLESPITLIHKDSPVPLWFQLRQQLEQQITAGVLAPGAALPPEHALAAQYGVSRATVRQATQALIDAGWLERRRGIGTFVVPAERRSPPRQTLRLGDPLLASEQPTETRLLERYTLTAGKIGSEVRTALALAPRDPVLLVTRLRAVDAVPVVLERVVLPLTGQVEPNEVDWTSGGVAPILEQWLGVTLGRLEVALTAVILDRPDAAQLQRQPGMPAMETRSTLYDAMGQPAAVIVALVPSDGDPHVIDMVARQGQSGGGVTLRQPHQSAEC